MEHGRVTVPEDPGPPYLPPIGSMLQDMSDLSLEVDRDLLASVIEFTRLLVRRSSVTNLIGPREKDRLWSRHILESFCYSRLLVREMQVIDIGTGNGFPGMILALMGFRVMMLEPRRKRYLFLRHAQERLSLKESSILNCRLEDLECAPSPAQYTARSVAPAPDLLSLVKGLSGPGTTLVVRESGISGVAEGPEVLELSSPPLDRSGFLVQYRV